MKVSRKSLEPDWKASAAIRKWITGWLSGGPHFIIGRPDDPYLLRWYIIPRNPWLSIYLHKFMRDDEDRALHDHPWWFLSWLIKGRYMEVVDEPVVILPIGDVQTHVVNKRRRWSLAFRPAVHRHRVVLYKRYSHNGEIYQSLPAWTFVVTGPRIRNWGFWCPQGFRPWEEFTAPNNPGEIGRGCA